MLRGVGAESFYEDLELSFMRIRSRIFMRIRSRIIICMNNYIKVMFFLFEDPEPIYVRIRSRVINCINNNKFVIIFGDPELICVIGIYYIC